MTQFPEYAKFNMLFRSSHQHIATFQLDLERERRLLCFAEKNDENEQNGSVENNEVEATGVDAVIQETRLGSMSALVVLQRQELASQLALSPESRLLAIESLFTPEQRENLPDDPELLEQMFDTALEQADNIDSLLRTLQQEKDMLDDITSKLESTYDIQRGVVTLERIKSVDAKIQAAALQENLPYNDFRGWLATGNATEEQVLELLGARKDDMFTEAPEKASVWEWVRNMFRKDRKRSYANARDNGSEEYSHQVTQHLGSQIHSAQTLLANTVQSTLDTVRTSFDARLQAYDTLYDKDIERAAAAIGISSYALIEIMEDVQEICDTPILEDATVDELMMLNNKAQRIAEEIRNDEEHPEKGIFGREKQRHAAAVQWAQNTARKIQAILAKPPATLPSEDQTLLQNSLQLLQLFQNPQTAGVHAHNQLALHYSNPATQRNISAFLAALSSASYRTQVEAYEQAVDAQEIPDTIDSELRAQTTERIHQLRERLFANNTPCREFQHEVFTALGLQSSISNLLRELEKKANLILAHKKNAQRAKTNMQEVQAQIQLLEAAVQTLAEMIPAEESERVRMVDPESNPDVFTRIPGLADAQGYFSHNDECIYINTARVRSPEQLAHVYHHEYGHALVHFLSRKTGLAAHLQLAPHLSNTPDTLEALAAKWKIPDGLSAAEKDDLLRDEMWVRYASWVHSGKPQLSNAAEQNMFVHMSGQEETPLFERGLFMTDPTADDETPSPSTSLRLADIPNLNRQLNRTKQELSIVTSLLASYPRSLPNRDILVQWYKDFSEALEKNIETPFLNQTITEEEGIAALDALKKKMEYKYVMEEIKQFKADQLRVDDIPLSGVSGFRAMLGSIQFLSIMDIVKMTKDGYEDLKRSWERSSEMKRHTIGQAITSLIPDNNISFFGLKYLGKLKHEYKRRGLASEVAEVGQWKESFKEIDPYELQEMLGTTEDKDQLRAVIELLYDAGRLDWNDEGFWKNLIRLSGEPMPIEACKNDDLLRDRWLRRMVTVIWDDKDKYYDWRRSNDSNYESGMGKFTEIADQLSNVSGGLSGELQRQLSMWVEARKTKSSIPNAVSPHMYEKVLKYAIENGKMTMEDKLFYLVQGVRYELISIDRLRVLAGEKGGVLLQFPFLDYFYGRNNTLPEIEAIAKRIENKEEEKKFKPGTNTTFWIQLEVMRDESVRQRVAKAADRVLESIDHEDIPTIIGQLDYNQMNNAADVISGSRQKITREGWKNAYTGFGSKFKAFARLSQMGDKHLARFTKNDAQNMASTITSYIHMDNILTGHSRDKESRPSLSWTEFEQGGPSTGGAPAKVFRNSNNAFIKTLIERLGTEINWDQFTNSSGVKKDVYLHRILGNQNSHPDTEDPKAAAKVVKASGTFVQVLTQALTSERGIQILQNTLREFTDTVDPEIRLHEENNGDAINLESATEYYKKVHEHASLAATV